jgi:predicted phosphodiesterase
VLLGILADSHGLSDKLRKGVETLKMRGADKILHLGDTADTLRPETVDECVSLLIENEIPGVMGNHEYSLVMHHFKRYPENFSERTKRYVRSLPRHLVIEEICFTHFSPVGGVYGLFAATDDDNYRDTIQRSPWPVIINGHSHDPRIYQQGNGTFETINHEIQAPFKLDKSCRYILTCGALEDSYCALFDFAERSFEIIFLSANSHVNT